MKNNKKLDQFLFELERRLGDLSPIDRSKIIIDIENHILESQEKYSDKSVEQILSDLGTPEKLANHYRLDKGLKTFKPKRHPLIKWLSITFLSSFGLFLVFILVIVWKFTPVFEINEKEQRITIFGGVIDINATSGKIKILDQYRFVDNKFNNHFEGSIDFLKDHDDVVINFISGQLDLKTSLERKVSWNCKLEIPPDEEFIEQTKSGIILNLEPYNGVDCEIKIPADAKLTVDGKDAQITVDNALFDTYIEIDNGQVYFNFNPEVDYNYDLKVEKGHVNSVFVDSKSSSAYEVRIYLKNGSIDRI